MAVKRNQDKYPQLARASVTMSAANTLTFNQLNTGIGVQDRLAWIIHSLEYYPSVGTMGEMTADGDYIELALSSTNGLTSLATGRAQLFDLFRILVTHEGTAADSHYHKFPILRDFSYLPGGGLLIPANNVYFGMTSNGLASAGVMEVRIRYSQVQLKDADFWELVQATQITQ